MINNLRQMKKLLNEILSQLGYVPFDRDREELYELYLDCCLRKGHPMEMDMRFNIRVRMVAMPNL